MVYAESKKWIPSQVLLYFKTGELRYGVTLFDWWNKTRTSEEDFQTKKTAQETWASFHDWYKKNNILPLTKEYLPKQLERKNYDDLPTLNQRHYQQLRHDHIDQIRMMINDKELSECYGTGKNPQNYNLKKLEIGQLSISERKIFNFFMLELDLYERVFIAKNQGLLEEEWNLWVEWLKIFKNNWVFKFTFDRMINIFDADFMNYLGDKIFHLDENAIKKLKNENQEKYS